MFVRNLIGLLVVVVAYAPAFRLCGAEIISEGTILPARQVVLQPSLYEGTCVRVTRVSFIEGSMVKKGQVLVELDEGETLQNSKIAETQVEQDQITLAGLERQLEYQANEFKRMEKGGQGIAQPEIDKAKYQVDLAKVQLDQHKATMKGHVMTVDQWRRRLDDYRILAPFDGVISKRNVEEGQTVECKTKLGELMEVSSVVIPVKLKVEQYDAINVNDPVKVTLDAAPGRTFPGLVFSKSPAADPPTKTFTLTVRVDNQDNALHPGWPAKVTFAAKDH